MKFLKKILEKAASALKNKALETVKGPVKEVTDFVGDPAGYMLGKLVEKMKALGSVATSMVIGPVQDIAERLKLERIKRLIKKIRETIEIAIDSIKALIKVISFVASNFLYIVCAIAIIWFIFSIFTAFSNLFSFSYGFDKTKYYDMDLFTAVKNKELMEENLYEKTSETSYYQRFVDAGIDGFSDAMFPEYLQSENAQFLSSKLKQELAQAQYTGFYTMDSRLTVHDANFGLLSDYIQANTVDTDIEASSVAQGYLRDYFSKESNFALSDQFLMELNNKAFASNGESGEDLKIVYPEMFVKPLAFTYDFNRMQLATDSKEPGTHWEEYTYVTQRVTNDEVGKKLEDIIVNPQELIWANYYGYGVNGSTTIGLADEGKIYSFASPIVWEYVVIDKDDYNIIDVKEDGTYSVENVQNKYDSEFLVLFNDEKETYEVAKFYYKISGRKSLLGAIESFNTSDGIDGTVGKWMKNVGTEEEPEWKDYKDSKYYSFTGPYISLNDGSTSSNDCFNGTALVASESTEEGLAGNGLKYFHYAIPTGYRLPEDINYNADGTLMARTINTIDVREDYNLDPQKHLQLAALSGSNDEIVVSSQELYNYKYFKIKSVKEEYRNTQDYVEGWARFLLEDTNAEFFNNMADRNFLEALGNRIAGLMNGIVGFFGGDTGDMETSMSPEDQNVIHLMASYPQEVLDLSIYLYEKKLVTGEGNLDQDGDGVEDAVPENVWDYNYSLDAYFTTDNSQLDSNEFYQKFYYLAEELHLIKTHYGYSSSSSLYQDLKRYFQNQKDYAEEKGISVSWSPDDRTVAILDELYDQLVVDGEANVTNNLINNISLWGTAGLVFGGAEAIENQLFMNYLSNQMTTKYTSTGVTKEHGDVVGGSGRLGEYSFVSNLGTNEDLKNEVVNYSYMNRNFFDQPSDTTMTFTMRSWTDSVAYGWNTFISWFTGETPEETGVTYTVSIDGEEHAHMQTDYYIGTMTEYSSGVYREHIKRLENDSVDKVPMDTTTDLPFELKSVRDYGLGSILNYVDSVVVNYKSGVFYDERYLGDEISKEILNNYKDAYRLGNADLTDPYDFKGFGADSDIKNASDAGLLDNSEGKGFNGAGLTSNSAQGLYNMVWGGYYPKEYRDFGTDRLIELFAQNNKKRFLTLLAENVDNKITELGDAYDKYNSTRVPISILGIKDGSKIKETGPDADYMDIENIELSLLNSSTKTYIDKIPEIYIPTNASKDESYELKDMLVAFPSLKDDNYHGRSMGQILGGFEIGFLTEDITKMAENDIFVFGDEFGYYTPYLDFSGWGDDKDISRVSQLLFPKRYYRSWLAKSDAEEDDDSLTVFKKLLKWVLKDNDYFNTTVNMPEKEQALSAKDHGITFAANFAEIYSEFAEGNETYLKDKTSPWKRLDESGQTTLWPSSGTPYDKTIEQSVSDGIFDTDSSHTYKGNNTYIYYLNNEMNYNIKNFKGNYGDYALISDSGLKKVYLIDEVVTFTGRFMYTYKDKLVALSTNDETDITKNIIGSYATDRYIFLDSWDIKLMADKVVDISFMFFRTDLKVRVDATNKWITKPQATSGFDDITIKEYLKAYNKDRKKAENDSLWARLEAWVSDFISKMQENWEARDSGNNWKNANGGDGKINEVFALAIPAQYVDNGEIAEDIKKMFAYTQSKVINGTGDTMKVNGIPHPGDSGDVYDKHTYSGESGTDTDMTVTIDDANNSNILLELMQYTEYVCSSFLMSNGKSTGYSVTPIDDGGGDYTWDIIQKDKEYHVNEDVDFSDEAQHDNVQNFTDLQASDASLLGIQYMNWWRKMLAENWDEVIGYHYGSNGKWQVVDTMTEVETTSMSGTTPVSSSTQSATITVVELAPTENILLKDLFTGASKRWGIEYTGFQPCFMTSSWQSGGVSTLNSTDNIMEHQVTDMDRITAGYLSVFNKMQTLANEEKWFLPFDDIHEDLNCDNVDLAALKSFMKSLLTKDGENGYEGNGCYNFADFYYSADDSIDFRESIDYIDDWFEDLKGSSTPIKVNEFINYLAREMFRIMDTQIIWGSWATAADGYDGLISPYYCGFVGGWDSVVYTFRDWIAEARYSDYSSSTCGQNCSNTSSYFNKYYFYGYGSTSDFDTTYLTVDSIEDNHGCGFDVWADFALSSYVDDYAGTVYYVTEDKLFGNFVNSEYNAVNLYNLTGDPLWVFPTGEELKHFNALLNIPKDGLTTESQLDVSDFKTSSFFNTGSAFEQWWEDVCEWWDELWETIKNWVTTFLDAVMDKVVITSSYTIRCLEIKDTLWTTNINWEDLWNASMGSNDAYDDNLSSIFNQYVKVLNIQKTDLWQEEVLYNFITYPTRGDAALSNVIKAEWADKGEDHVGVCHVSCIAFTYTIKVSDEMALDIDNGRYYSQVSNLGRLDKATNSTEINDNTIEINTPSDENENAFIINYHGAYVEETGVDTGHLSGELFNVRAKDIVTEEFLNIYNEEARNLNAGAKNYTLEEWEKAWAPELKVFDSINQIPYTKDQMKEYLYGTYLNAENKDAIEKLSESETPENNYITLFETIGTGENSYKRLRTDLATPLKTKYINYSVVYNTSNWENTKFFGLIGTENFNYDFLDYLFSANLIETIEGNGINNAIYNDNENTLLKGYPLVYEASDGADTETKIYKQQRFQALWPFANNGTEDRAFTNIDKNFQSNINEGPKEVMTLESALANVSEEDKSLDTTAFLNALNRVYGEELYQMTKDSLVNTASGTDTTFDLDEYKDLFGITGFVMVPRIADRRDEPTTYPLYRYFVGARKQIAPEQIETYFEGQTYDSWISRMQIDGSSSNEDIDFYNRESTRISKYIYDYLTNFEAFIPYNIISDSDLEIRGTAGYGDLMTNRTYETNYTTRFTQYFINEASKGYWSNYLEMYGLEPIDLAQLLQGIAEVNLENAGEEALNILRSTAISARDGVAVKSRVIVDNGTVNDMAANIPVYSERNIQILQDAVINTALYGYNNFEVTLDIQGGGTAKFLLPIAGICGIDDFFEEGIEEEDLVEENFTNSLADYVFVGNFDDSFKGATTDASAATWYTSGVSTKAKDVLDAYKGNLRAAGKEGFVIMLGSGDAMSSLSDTSAERQMISLIASYNPRAKIYVVLYPGFAEKSSISSSTILGYQSKMYSYNRKLSSYLSNCGYDNVSVLDFSSYFVAGNKAPSDSLVNNDGTIVQSELAKLVQKAIFGSNYGVNQDYDNGMIKSLETLAPNTKSINNYAKDLIISKDAKDSRLNVSNSITYISVRLYKYVKSSGDFMKGLYKFYYGSDYVNSLSIVTADTAANMLYRPEHGLFYMPTNDDCKEAYLISVGGGMSNNTIENEDGSTRVERVQNTPAPDAFVAKENDLTERGISWDRAFSVDRLKKVFSFIKNADARKNLATNATKGTLSQVLYSLEGQLPAIAVDNPFAKDEIIELKLEKGQEKGFTYLAGNTYVYEGIQQSMPNDVVEDWTEVFVDTSLKTHTNAVKNDGSLGLGLKGGELVAASQTDEYGMLYIEEDGVRYYLVALGSAFMTENANHSLGGKFVITTDEGNSWYAIQADVKADRHTSTDNTFTAICYAADAGMSYSRNDDTTTSRMLYAQSQGKANPTGLNTWEGEVSACICEFEVNAMVYNGLPEHFGGRIISIVPVEMADGTAAGTFGASGNKRNYAEEIWEEDYMKYQNTGLMDFSNHMKEIDIEDLLNTTYIYRNNNQEPEDKYQFTTLDLFEDRQEAKIEELNFNGSLGHSLVLNAMTYLGSHYSQGTGSGEGWWRYIAPNGMIYDRISYAENLDGNGGVSTSLGTYHYKNPKNLASYISAKNVQDKLDIDSTTAPGLESDATYTEGLKYAFDCSSFVSQMYIAMGYNVPGGNCSNMISTNSANLYKAAGSWTFDDLKIGDVFINSQHTMIYIGDYFINLDGLFNEENLRVKFGKDVWYTGKEVLAHANGDIASKIDEGTKAIIHSGGYQGKGGHSCVNINAYDMDYLQTYNVYRFIFDDYDTKDYSLKAYKDGGIHDGLLAPTIFTSTTLENNPYLVNYIRNTHNDGLGMSIEEYINAGYFTQRDVNRADAKIASVSYVALDDEGNIDDFNNPEDDVE